MKDRLAAIQKRKCHNWMSGKHNMAEDINSEALQLVFKHKLSFLFTRYSPFPSFQSEDIKWHTLQPKRIFGVAVQIYIKI